jgi:hypothetical protein
MPNDTPSNCVRASFSTASDEHIEIALERLATLLREHARPGVTSPVSAAAAATAAAGAAASAPDSSSSTVCALRATNSSGIPELFLPAPFHLLVSNSAAGMQMQALQQPPWDEASSSSTEVHVTRDFAEACAEQLRRQQQLREQLQSFLQ